MPDAVLQELSLLNATHDVFLVLIDSAFAFDLPAVSAGWIEIVDVETGRARTISRARATRELAARAAPMAGRGAAGWRRMLELDVVHDRPRSDDRPTSRSASSSPSGGCGRQTNDVRGRIR